MSNASERYVNLNTKTLPDGRQVYTSALPLRVVGNPLTDPTLVANESDRLDILAHNVYGDATQWWRIASANRMANGTLHVTPGVKLLIPRI